MKASRLPAKQQTWLLLLILLDNEQGGIFALAAETRLQESGKVLNYHVMKMHNLPVFRLPDLFLCYDAMKQTLSAFLLLCYGILAKFIKKVDD